MGCLRNDLVAPIIQIGGEKIIRLRLQPVILNRQRMPIDAGLDPAPISPIPPEVKTRRPDILRVIQFRSQFHRMIIRRPGHGNDFR